MKLEIQVVVSLWSFVLDLCEFEASLVYRVSSRTTRATKRNPVWKNQTKQTKP